MFQPPPPGPPTTAPAQETVWEIWARKLTTIRDGLLAVGGFLFLSGFLVTEWNAWRLGLGFVSLSPAQYMMSGFIPAFVFFLVALSIMVGHWLSVFTSRWAETGSPEEVERKNQFIRVWFDRIMGVIPVAMIGLLSVDAYIKLNFSRAYNIQYSQYITKLLAYVMPSVIMLLLIIFLTSSAALMRLAKMYHPDENLWRTSGSRFIRNIILITFPVIACFFALNYYATAVHTSLAQEVGGLRPRIAYLDVSRGLISKETRIALLPKESVTIGKGTDSTPVVRTQLMEVAYEGSDFYLVRPYGHDTVPTYRLRKDVVQSISWLGYDEPKKP